MPSEVRELRVFMASPGDLSDEREALRHVERRLNANLRARGVRVSIEGWEEVPPGFGRPQALINPLVRECEVFIGLLHARWGSETGTHTSGFEEEFEIALARRTDDGREPAIGMFFRDIAADRLADPGRQLTAVLAFQHRVREERLVLYKTFEGADQLALEIYDFLMPYALDLAEDVFRSTSGVTDEAGAAPGSPGAGNQPSAAPKSAGSAAAESDADAAADAETKPRLDGAQQQIVDALNKFGDGFAGDGGDFDPVARDRVTLVGTAFAEDPDILGGHLVNRLYRQRDNLQLTLGEARTWYRTHFSSTGSADRAGRTIPIWGAVGTGRNDKDVTDEIALQAGDSNVSVVRGALRFLIAHRIRPQRYWPDLSGLSMQEESTSLVEDAVRTWVDLLTKFGPVDIPVEFIAALATAADVPLLEAIAASEDLRDDRRRVVSAMAKTLAGDVSDAEALAPPKYAGDDSATLQQLLIDVIPKLSSEQQRSLLNGTSDRVIAAAAIGVLGSEDLTAEEFELIARKKAPPIRDAIVERARGDLDWTLEKVALLRASSRASFGDLVSRLLAASAPAPVLEEIDATEQFTMDVWVARTLQQPELFVQDAREVLDGTAAFVDQRVADLRGEYEVVADHLDASARAGACGVIASLNEPSDADFDRVANELRRDHLLSRGHAIQALVAMAHARRRDGEDPLPDLGDLSVLDDFMAQEVIDALLDSPVAAVVVPLWLGSEIASLREAARSWQLRQPEASDAELEEALYEDGDDLRIVAVDALIARWDKTALEELLARYDQTDRAYWYNVIAALDEHLYGYSSDAVGTPTDSNASVS